MNCVVTAMSEPQQEAWLHSSVPIYLGGGWSVQPDRYNNTFAYSHDANREFVESVQEPETAGYAPHPSLY